MPVLDSFCRGWMLVRVERGCLLLLDLLPAAAAAACQCGADGVGEACVSLPP